MAKKSTKTGKTTKPVKKTGKKRRKKSKINYTGAIAGFLAVCVIMLAVFLFIIPSVKNKDETTNKTQIAKEQEKIEEEKPKTTEKPPIESKAKDKRTEKTKETETQAAKNLPKEAAKKTLQDKPKEIEKPNKKNKAKKPENPIITDKPKPQEQEPDVSAYPIQDLPELPSKGKLIFVFDDAGHNLEQLQYFLDLPFPCTIAVLPKLPNSRETARRIRAAGKELILHQPMQALNPNINPGDGAVKPGMDREEIKKIVASNVEEIGPIAGMNNHEGSLITSDEKAMEAVLELCREKNIYFLDSRT